MTFEMRNHRKNSNKSIMRYIINSFVTLLFPLVSMAQMGNELTIFSSDGIRFSLIVNGWQVNEAPQSTVLATDLMAEFVHVVLNFEDKSIPQLRRNVLQLRSVENGMGIPESVVYELIERKGKMVLRWRSSNPLPPPPPPQTIIVREEVPIHVPVHVPAPAHGIEINAPGVNVRVTAPAPF